MRVSKDPDIRKQEILDVAMRVFAEKGYETTTMKDIAREAGVVAGLCYHYFQNKHALYQEALTQYAKACSKPFADIFKQIELPLNKCIDILDKISENEVENYKYRDFFDKDGNELFHAQLEVYMSKEIFPHLETYIKSLMDRGEIEKNDAHLLAHFIWGGQMAVTNNAAGPVKEKNLFLKQMLTLILK
ncbi:TetR/AcrR family transcriptional regulator [Eubacterium sp. 1001713B170207_170306_E7]|uniref:TetR/AcrR family transcriptional regulator n=1 Tax=Eubacterium sp. 1001713B170207_170306_E7 TaxID=2787097 RepID=UPI001897C65B|nr:TetR/AcrR family transcriptional regulator [Eubacterium sp. 1001713B170207_170306_E7]